MAALIGYEHIAHYLSSCVPTVKKYIKDHDLPVRKIGDAKNATVITTSEMLDEWIKHLPGKIE